MEKCAQVERNMVSRKGRSLVGKLLGGDGKINAKYYKVVEWHN